MSTSALRPRLAELAPSLRPIADDVLGETSRIDLVAIDATGAAVAVFDAESDNLASFTRALAGAAWLEVHLPDWCQIAPQLGIDAMAPVRALLLATSFEPETRAAARLVGESRIQLMDAPLAARPEPRARTPHEARGILAARRPVPAAPLRPPSQPFRTGLTDADLGVRDRTA